MLLEALGNAGRPGTVAAGEPYLAHEVPATRGLAVREALSRAARAEQDPDVRAAIEEVLAR